MSKQNQSGFTVVEGLLIVVILAIVGGTGFFVWHSKQSADKSLSDTASSQPAIMQSSKVMDFASCKAATGSVLQETFPEKCVTKNGKSFIDAQSQTSDTVQTAKLSAVPADLRAAVLAHASCAKDGQLLDEGGNPIDNTDYYIANKAAFVSECQAIGLYVYTGGQWTALADSQGGFKCALMQQHAVPVALVKAASPGNKCIDANNNYAQYQL